MTAICVRFVAALAAAFSAFLLGATPVVAGTTERSVYYSYDVMGRQLTAKFDSTAGADGVTNVYNGFGDLTSSTISMSGFSAAVGSSYDQGGRRTAVVHPDGQTFTYAYDALGRLSGLYEGAGTGTVLDTFSYGNNGLVSSRSEAGGSSVSYGYDDIGRLTSQSDAFLGGTGNVNRTFGYNPASGIVTETRDNDNYAFPTSQIGAVNRPYAVNGLNQYSSAGPASFTYDANGNLITDGTWTYTYDVENRLVHATGAGKDVTLIYDPLGRLYFVGGSNVGDVHFVYDGDALIEEYSSTGAMTNRYVHGSNAAADDPLVWYAGSAVGSGNRQWLHADHLGSIVARTNGGAPSINSYDEYGIPATNNAGRFGYTGQAWLYEIGLDYYKARMYSPTLGRFLQTDPIGYKDQVNLYEYVGDDPVDYNDPTGNDSCGSRLDNNDSAGCFGSTGSQGAPTSQQERKDLRQGNSDAYWQSRQKRGDPLGKEGQQFSLNRHGSRSVEEAKATVMQNLLLKHGGQATYIHGLRLVAGGDRAAATQEYNQIRLDLAVAHMQATDADMSGIPHDLSAFQIADYHWRVFAQHGLPANTFGGSPAFGTRAEVFVTQFFWCAECDR